MGSLCDLEDGFEADALFACVSLSRRLGTPSCTTQCLNVLLGKACLIAFNLDQVREHSYANRRCRRLQVLIVVCILDDFHQKSGSVRVQTLRYAAERSAFDT